MVILSLVSLSNLFWLKMAECCEPDDEIIQRVPTQAWRNVIPPLSPGGSPQFCLRLTSPWGGFMKVQASRQGVRCMEAMTMA